MTLPERFEPGRNRSAPERLKPVEFRLRAAVAELVDAQASGACVRKNVEVRVLSAASNDENIFLERQRHPRRHQEG